MSVFRNRIILSKLCCLLSLFLLVSTFPVFSAPQGTGEKIPTNYEIITQVSSEAIDELISNMPSLERNSLILLTKSRGPGNIEFVFQNTLLKKMTGRGLRVAEKRPEEEGEGDGPDYELTYQIIRLTLKYPKINRSYWIGAKEVDRLSEIGVFAQLADLSTGDIVWVGDTQKKYQDRIAYAMLDQVEDPQHDFTRPPRKELRWSKLIEPVIVTGIVSGLVYLFFSNQTSEE
ncbi:MAG: hypothetical protein JXB45_09750 [Candidatus Krumholzibacteriota bacterium]|nr:hypothetical protein [Candidatus Krumholzibacteriota bacterium]